MPDVGLPRPEDLCVDIILWYLKRSLQGMLAKFRMRKFRTRKRRAKKCTLRKFGYSVGAGSEQ